MNLKIIHQFKIFIIGKKLFVNYKKQHLTRPRNIMKVQADKWQTNITFQPGAINQPQTVESNYMFSG